MNKFDEYLYAAAIVGITKKYNSLGDDYENQDDSELFIYECLATNAQISGINRVLDRMESGGLVSVIKDDVAGKFYRFEKDKIYEIYTSYLENPDTIGGKLATVGLKFFYTALSNSNFNHQDDDSVAINSIAPASDRLVRFDDNSVDASEVIELTQTADEAIRGSNSLDEEERGWIRDYIKVGIEFIKKHKKMLAATASALLLKPLLAAYEAVAEEPAKVAIMAAIEAVKLLFGI